MLPSVYSRLRTWLYPVRRLFFFFFFLPLSLFQEEEEGKEGEHAHRDPREKAGVRKVASTRVVVQATKTD